MSKEEIRGKAILEALLDVTLLYPRELPVSCRTIFLVICLHPGIRLVDIESKSKVKSPVVSRHCRELEKVGLIEIKPNPLSRREKNAFLTEQGRVQRDRLVTIISDASACVPPLRRASKKPLKWSSDD